LCSKRLHPFLPELVKVLRRHGDKTMTAEIEVKLCQISTSTIDRLLRPYRRLGGRHPFATTKPGSLLKNAIPIRTFVDWQDGRPGFLEADLVSHCGESSEGFYLTTLSTVDVATGWSVVRRLIVYDRYNSRAALEALDRVYDLLRLYINFFQPVMKLQDKTRHGAKVHKVL